MSDLNTKPLSMRGSPSNCVTILNGGGYYEYTKPWETQPTINEIARGLANTCRYAGQVTRFYSVAEHSFLMSYIVAPEFRYAALMHDAAEAFIGDMPKPLKEILPDYKKVERDVEFALSLQFNIPFPLPPEVKYADSQMLVIEKEDLLQNNDIWVWTKGAERPLGIKIRCWQPDEAYDQFMGRYFELTRLA